MFTLGEDNNINCYYCCCWFC